MKKKQERMEVLLVEDNPADVRLTREALQESRRGSHLSVVADGVEALAFLRREGPYRAAPRPHIVLLDLNLPKKGGHEVLETIKADDTLRHIPVVILTTSTAEDDVVRSYELEANCHITKPVDLDEFVHVVKAVEGFCHMITALPPGE